jgi:hypothetical protein
MAATRRARAHTTARGDAPFAAPDNVKNRVKETFFGRQYGGEIKVGRVGLDLSTTERLRSWQYVLKIGFTALCSAAG